MTEAHPHAPEIKQPPSGITREPMVLDDVTFTPHDKWAMEIAARDGVHVGDILLDDNRVWFVRKVDGNGDLSDWKEMRCVHEARALLVSKIRQ